MPLEQQKREGDEAFERGVIGGAYWMRRPDPNARLAIAYQGAVATDAIRAAGLLSERARGIGVLAMTSADRLNAGWQAASRARRGGGGSAGSHVDRPLMDLAGDARLVTVADAHPAGLSWLGGVRGHRTVSPGVEHFGQAGTVEDVWTRRGIDAASIARAASAG